MVLTAAGVKRKIIGAHMLAASKVPEPVRPIVMISDEEAGELADAIYAAAQHFNFAEALDNKWIALGWLAYVSATIYLPRFAAMAEIQRQLKQMQQAGIKQPFEAPGAPPAPPFN